MIQHVLDFDTYSYKMKEIFFFFLNSMVTIMEEVGFESFFISFFHVLSGITVLNDSLIKGEQIMSLSYKTFV